jgi:dethiobiotin synthetase
MTGGARPRPDRLVLVVGTGTEIGKTWVSVALLRALRGDGVAVAARKPAQSFEPGDPTTDAAELGASTGEAPTTVCPPHRWYEVPMAPPMAAEVLGRPPFTVADLAEEIAWPDGVEVGLVESAGGVRSPLAADGDATDLAAHLRPDLVLLVADAGLGTINSVRLTADAVRAAWDRSPGPTLVVLLNRFDPHDDLHRRNAAWLADRDGLSVVTAIEPLAALVRGG